MDEPRVNLDGPRRRCRGRRRGIRVQLNIEFELFLAVHSGTSSTSSMASLSPEYDYVRSPMTRSMPTPMSLDQSCVHSPHQVQLRHQRSHPPPSEHHRVHSFPRLPCMVCLTPPPFVITSHLRWQTSTHPGHSSPHLESPLVEASDPHHRRADARRSGPALGDDVFGLRTSHDGAKYGNGRGARERGIPVARVLLAWSTFGACNMGRVVI